MRETDDTKSLWLLRYIVTAETAALVMMITFFATGYSSLVTKKELGTLAPYVKDQATIKSHMSKSEDILLQLGESLYNLNMQILKTNNVLDKRIQRVENTLAKK